MDKKFEPLFTPWKIGNCEIKNRIVLCPMGGTSIFGWMERHHFDKDAGDFFMDLAKNNVGLIIPGIAPLRNLIGGQWLYKAKGAFRKLKKYMQEFHKTGAKMFVQLTAGFGRSFSIPNALVPMLKNKFLGTLIKPIFNVSYLCASPSELPSRWAQDAKCRALTKKEIEDMIKAFAKTAKMCKDAGVDGVEVHAVHEGYLLDQFTLKYTNKRTDEYGGSFENRYRFPVAVVKAIKDLCGKDYPVSLRYSVESKTIDFCEGALPGEKYKEIGRDMQESEKAAKYLQDAGYDMLNSDNGTYDAWYWAHPPGYMPNNCNLEDVAHIRKFVDIPVVCAGKMEPEVAAKAIKNKEIDAMGVARQFLTDSHWVTKLMQDELEDIMPCIHCHNGCFPLSHYKGVASATAMSDSKHMARCALNPMTMDGGHEWWKYVYDEYYDCIICPEYHTLTYSTTNRDGYREYKSNPETCKNCPTRHLCTHSKDCVKVVQRHIWKDYEELADDARYTPKYANLYKQRKETIERVFADAKEKHAMRYTPYRGLAQVSNWVRLKFAAMNLKKFAKRKWSDIHPSLFFAFFSFFSRLYSKTPISALA